MPRPLPLNDLSATTPAGAEFLGRICALCELTDEAFTEALAAMERRSQQPTWIGVRITGAVPVTVGVVPAGS